MDRQALTRAGLLLASVLAVLALGAGRAGAEAVYQLGTGTETVDNYQGHPTTLNTQFSPAVIEPGQGFTYHWDGYSADSSACASGGGPPAWWFTPSGDPGDDWRHFYLERGGRLYGGGGAPDAGLSCDATSVSGYATHVWSGADTADLPHGCYAPTNPQMDHRYPGTTSGTVATLQVGADGNCGGDAPPPPSLPPSPPAATATLTVTGSGGGSVASDPAGIACAGTCAHAFAQGTSVTLTTDPDDGHTFDHWTGACSGYAETCVVRLNADLSVGAVFEQCASGRGDVRVGLATVHSACWRKKDGLWRSDGPISINGVRAAGGGPFTADTSRGEVSSEGRTTLSVDLGDARRALFAGLLRWRTGERVVHLRSIPIPNFVAGVVPTGAVSFTLDGTGADFAVSVRIPFGRLPKEAKELLDAPAGFEAKVEGTAGPAGVAFDSVRIRLKDVPVYGDFKLAEGALTYEPAGNRFEGLVKVELPYLNAPSKGLEFIVAKPEGTIEVAIEKGRLQQLDLEADHLNLRLFSLPLHPALEWLRAVPYFRDLWAIYLDRLGFHARFDPRALSAEIGLGLGPPLKLDLSDSLDDIKLADGPLVGIDGVGEYQPTSAASRWTITGHGELLGIPALTFADLKVVLGARSTTVDAAGKLPIFLVGELPGFGPSGLALPVRLLTNHLHGEIVPHSYAFSDRMRVQVPVVGLGGSVTAGFEDLGTADVTLSDRGGTLCVALRRPATFTFGLTARTGRPWRPLTGSCDVGPLRSLPATRTRAAGGASASFAVPSAEPGLVVFATGQGAAPSADLVGPGGRRLAGPAAPGIERSALGLAIRDEKASTTIWIVDHPATGTWRLQARAGSAPIAAVARADGLRPPRVAASVTGHGKSRRLTWRARLRRDQRLAIYEEAGGILRALPIHGRTRGHLRFRPIARTARVHHIVAYVEQDGVPRLRVTPARFRV